MREVLFRGRRKDNGAWVEGYYVYSGKHYIICDLEVQSMSREENDLYATEWYEVIPETVGPCIGLTDRNGNKVFRGDILKSHWDEDNPEDFCYEVVLWCDNGWCIKQGTAMPDRLDGVFKDDRLECSEVVGNVYDNPELLEVEMQRGD